MILVKSLFLIIVSFRCAVLEVLDTVQLYPKLNFEVDQSPLWIWDEKMEYRYWEELKLWNERPLKVIVVPFSHNDAGWHDTFEEYYEQKSKYILDNIVNILPELEHMTFVWSEICFLQRWWERSSEKAKRTFRKLVHDGRVEIVTGGWVMPDEATTTLFALHNQLIEGHQWVWEELGVRPEYSWSIDPFGCSSTMAKLLAGSGLRGLVVQRVHYAWKRFLSEAGLLELEWAGLSLHVQPGPGYTVTDSCGPALALCPDFDFNLQFGRAQPVTYLNVHAKAEILLGLYGRVGSLSRDNVALISVGGDFRFQNASEWTDQYNNYKAIFDYINGNKKIYKARLQFGTLKTFFSNIREPNVTLEGDFFPYADVGPDKTLGYWTGYFTTRPHVKRLSRAVDSTLRSAELLYTLVLNTFLQQGAGGEAARVGGLYPGLVRARRAAALFQHHDGITGTARARVMRDFRGKLVRALCRLKAVLTTAAGVLLGERPQDEAAKYLVVFNSLPHYRTEVVALKTDFPALVVRDPAGNELPHQINCQLNRNPECNGFCLTTETYELVFLSELAPLSLTTFQIQTRDSNFKKYEYITLDKDKSINGIILTNSKQAVTFSENGLVNHIKKSFGEVCLNVILKAYISQATKSGAYLFQPVSERAVVYSDIPEGNIVFLDGTIYKEITAIYVQNYIVSTRLYQASETTDEFLEIKITYNMTRKDTELVIEFASDLNNTHFFTDVNGFEMRERVREEGQPIGGRYYPMTCLAYLENSNYRLAFLTDHSHGTASLRDGAVEIMLDRRIWRDDLRGLEEGVEDNVRTTSTIRLVFQERTAEGLELLTALGLELDHPSAVIPMKGEPQLSCYRFISSPFPGHVHLLNLRTLSEGAGPSARALMLLHNTSPCNTTFPPETAFNSIIIRGIARTGLTGLTEGEELAQLSDINLPPRDIQSFKVFF